MSRRAVLSFAFAVSITLTAMPGLSQEAGYYVGLTRQPTPIFKSADTTKPAGYLAAGSIVSFMHGISWGLPVDNRGYIKAYIFDNNVSSKGGYTNAWVPDGALDLFGYACDEQPAYGGTACPPVDLLGMMHQQWAKPLRAELASEAERLGITLAPKAIIKKAAYDSAVIASANVSLPDYNPAPWLEVGEPVSAIDYALGVGTRVATREANRQINRAERKANAAVDAAVGEVGEIEDAGQSVRSATSETLTNQSVIDMLAQGLSKEIVVMKVQMSPGAYDLSNKGLKQLQDKKVPMDVIGAMMAK